MIIVLPRLGTEALSRTKKKNKNKNGHLLHWVTQQEMKQNRFTFLKKLASFND